MEPGRRACVVGVGESAYYRWGKAPKSELALTCDAILAACADAGLEPAKLDGFASYSEDRNEPALLMEALGTETLRLGAMVWGGGGGGSCGALAHAAAAVEAGYANYVVAFRGLAQGQYFRFGTFHPWSPQADFTAPFGLFSPAQLFALIARRHMHEFGTTSEQMAAVALACRAHAARNPRAVMRSELTLEMHQESRLIADPLRLYDCCLESDGACAVVVTTAERARDLKAKPVRVLAAGQGAMHRWGTDMLGGHNMPDEIYASAGQKALAAELFGRAGVGPGDVDTAQLYDAFTPTVLFTLEDFGFCARGEAGPFAASGALNWPDGALPVNTAGGNLSEAYIHGFNLIAEAVRQLRGESTSQVAGAEVCVVSGGESVNPTSAAILGCV